MGQKHDYTQHEQGERYAVAVSPSTLYGYFENHIQGGEGGLWFGARDDGKPGLALVDFDGYAVLPYEVGQLLTKLGYQTPVDNFADEAKAAALGLGV